MRNATHFILVSTIKNCHELKETLSETMTMSDNWFVINVDCVYCTAFLCISDGICSSLHTCSVPEQITYHKIKENKKNDAGDADVYNVKHLNGSEVQVKKVTNGSLVTFWLRARVENSEMKWTVCTRNHAEGKISFSIIICLVLVCPWPSVSRCDLQAAAASCLEYYDTMPTVIANFWVSGLARFFV